MPLAYEVTAWGAGFTAMYAPLAGGEDESQRFNVLLSLPHASFYRTHPHPYLHSTIGRTANRIANARLDDLNGRSYTLAANNGPNNSHGGSRGWDKREWRDDGMVMRSVERGIGDESVRWAGDEKDEGGRREEHLFSLTSPDGDEGFPGTVEARVWYAEGVGPAGENIVEVEWEAELLDEGIETVVSMTNHAYFNLNPPVAGSSSADRTVADHTAKLGTSRYLPSLTDNPGVPEGRFDAFPGIPKVPFASFPLSDEDDDILDVDDCFVLDEEPSTIPTDTRKWPLQTLAEVYGDRSNVHLTVESTEPAFQFYTGKWNEVPPWEAGSDGNDKWEAGDGYGPFSGFCVEPSRYVNAAGRKAWRSMVLLKKGELYGAKTRYIISRTAGKTEAGV